MLYQSTTDSEGAFLPDDDYIEKYWENEIDYPVHVDHFKIDGVIQPEPIKIPEILGSFYITVDVNTDVVLRCPTNEENVRKWCTLQI